MTRRTFLAVSLAFLLVGPVVAQPKATATLTVDFWAMPIYKDGVGRWHTANEPADLTVEWPGGKMDAGRAKRKAGDVGYIPETPVLGIVRRNVSACELHGTFSDGSKLVMCLPREAVRFSHLERQGLRIKAVMVAVAIDCPTTIVKPSGDVYSGIITIPSCEAHGVNGRMRVADAVSCRGILTKLPLP